VCRAPWAADRGEYLLSGGNTWSCSKVEEGNVKERFFPFMPSRCRGEIKV
jgi:hypothetical protein